jgi:Domain of unknown function (DUF1844)
MSDIENPDTAAPGSAEEYPLPPATFEFLVLRTVTEAQMFLGLLRFGEEEAPAKPNLRAAQHAIDLLAMLLEKTRGNLGLDETRFLENSLTELRFRYVQVAGDQAK